MKPKFFITLFAVSILFAVGFLLQPVSQAETDAEKELQKIKSEYAPVLALTGIAKQEILAIANVLSQNPDMAIDFSHKSGEYCMAFGNLNMVHYSTQPTETKEDVIYILNAKPFIENGLQVDKMPRLPEETGKMEPGTWYYYAGDKEDPHHKAKLPVPVIMMAVDVK